MSLIRKINHDPLHQLNEDIDYPYAIDIHDLSLILNNYCNRACKHCYVKFEKNQMDIKPEWVQWCIDHFKLQKVIIVGGEPLLSPSLPKIIDMLSANKVRITISTNSKWIDEHWRKKEDGTLKTTDDVLGILQDVDSIQVSIEGMKEYNDSIRGEHHFDDAMQAVDLLKQKGKDVFFRVTYSRDTLGMVQSVIDLAEQLGVHVYFFPYKGNDKPPLSAQQQAWFYDLLIEHTSEDGKKLAMAAIPQYICYIGHESDWCPAGKQLINIMPDGTVTPCEMSTPPYHFPLGKFTDRGLDTDYFYERLETFLFEMKQMDLACISCKHHKVCRSGCLETNEYLTCPLKEHMDVNYSIYHGDMDLSRRQVSSRAQAVTRVMATRKGC
jgi:radical SAM protein with 4Fe4S-binding SPASM domain